LVAPVFKMSTAEWTLPVQKLAPGDGKTPKVVLLACGSFSPVTFMHLRMFEQAKDHAIRNGINVVGGYFSPVTDAYNKKGLASAKHRAKMCELATESSSWIMVDAWESQQSEYLTTVSVLRHLQHCLSKQLNELFHVRLLCGADLLESFNKPGLWATEDIKEIVGKFGIIALDRAGVDSKAVIFENDILFQYQSNILLVPQHVVNEVSSTKVRQSISRGLSINYLVPEPVVQYISAQKLFSPPM